MSLAAGYDSTYQPTHDPLTVLANLKEALDALAARRREIVRCWRYYDGNHPQLWMTERLRRVFGPLYEGSLQTNLCELAVEAPVRRLQVTGWTAKHPPEADEPAGDGSDPDASAATPPAEQSAVTFAQAQWDANRLDLEQEELYRSAQVAGEHYVMVWPRYELDDLGRPTAVQATNDDGTPLYDMVLADARCVYVKYGPRGQRLWAAQIWLDIDARCWRAVIYYPDEIVRRRTPPTQVGGRGPSSEWPQRADRFTPDPDDPGGPNPLGVVGVYRFARDKAGRSRLRQLIPIQDKINKLEANKMVAAEFLAWRQRYILSAQDIDDDKLRPSPGSVLVLDPGGDGEEGNVPATKVGEFAATDLSNYDGATQKEIEHFFTVAQLPKHLLVNPGADPSGDAVRADEGPFVALVDDYAQMFGGTWADIMTDLGAPDVIPQWADTEVANGTSSATEVKTLVDAGVPVDLAMRHVYGWDEDLLDQLRAGKLAADQQTATAHAQAGAMALAAFDQGRGALDNLGG